MAGAGRMLEIRQRNRPAYRQHRPQRNTLLRSKRHRIDSILRENPGVERNRIGIDEAIRDGCHLAQRFIVLDLRPGNIRVSTVWPLETHFQGITSPRQVAHRQVELEAGAGSLGPRIEYPKYIVTWSIGIGTGQFAVSRHHEHLNLSAPGDRPSTHYIGAVPTNGLRGIHIAHRMFEAEGSRAYGIGLPKGAT